MCDVKLKPCRQCGGKAKSNTYDVSIECSACGYEEETAETWNADRNIDTSAIEAAESFKNELLTATKAFVHPHIEGVFAVWRDRIEQESKS